MIVYSSTSHNVAGFLIPGVNAYVTLTVTICTRKDEWHYIAVSQAQFVLRDIPELLMAKKFVLTLSKIVQVRILYGDVGY
jgi:hypothetical protein